MWVSRKSSKEYSYLIITYLEVGDSIEQVISGKFSSFYSNRSSSNFSCFSTDSYAFLCLVNGVKLTLAIITILYNIYWPY
jgi:hypothetical protein